MAPTQGDFMVPVPSDEAIWIGLVPDGRGPTVLVCVAAEVGEGEIVDAVSGARAGEGPFGGAAAGLVVPPTSSVDGIARAGGTWWPFARVSGGPDAPACRAIRLFAIPARGRARAQPPEEPATRLHDLPGPPEGNTGAPAPQVEPLDGQRWDLESPASVRVRLSDPGAFTAATGTRLRPLDPDAVYRGWRLP